MTHAGKDIFNRAIRTKWLYKKHTHASVNQIYELRGHISRKIKLWVGGGILRTSSLAQYKTSKRITKRVTNGYNRRLVVE
jgi:hypothetical protein